MTTTNSTIIIARQGQSQDKAYDKTITRQEDKIRERQDKMRERDRTKQHKTRQDKRATQDNNTRHARRTCTKAEMRTAAELKRSVHLTVFVDIYTGNGKRTEILLIGYLKKELSIFLSCKFIQKQDKDHSVKILLTLNIRFDQSVRKRK
jgi:hypothetical protein